MDKRAILADALGIIGVCALVAGFILFAWQSSERTPSRPVTNSATTQNLGIVYVPLSPQLAEAYDIQLESGALVTYVVPDSLAENAGVMEGDVVTGCNGTKLDSDTQLFGVMRACRLDQNVVLEVWRDNRSFVITIFRSASQ